MHVPLALLSLVDEGIIDEVLRPLKSGKEAQIFLVRAGGDVRVAKIYKDAEQRSFKQRAQYTEGRRIRNSRDQRAMQKRTRHGKAQEEEAWKSAEVEAIYRVHDQGVRVPTPYNFIDGVLIMELVQGPDGEPAPRLSELTLGSEVASSYFDQLLREVIKMLCAGIVHGDLSDYNVLIDTAGPVIIDFPQWVDAASNRNARKLLVRDVDNLGAFLRRYAPWARRKPYGQEIWAAYESNVLTPEFELKGQFRRSSKPVDTEAVLDEIEDASEDERRRREASGGTGPPPRRREVIVTPASNQQIRVGGRARKRRSGRQRAGEQNAGSQRAGSQHAGSQRAAKQRAAKQRAAAGPGQRDNGRQRTQGAGMAGGGDSMRASDEKATPKRRRRRRRRGGAAKGSASGQSPQRTEAGNSRTHAPSSSKPSSSASSPNQEAASNPTGSRRRRRRRKRSGAEPRAGDATSDRPERTRTKRAD